MSVSLAFRFLAGRYHATPYGHHVNEGLIEWPPSPWRLLRALISVGYTSGVWNGTGLLPEARSLIENLSAELPRYFIPPMVGTHSRHYMPIGALDEKKIEKTTLVFDTWARVKDQDLVVTWSNVPLDDDERNMLGVLMERLNYLGRSESWVQGRVIGEGEQIPEANCFPEEYRDNPGHGWEQITLLAPNSASDFKTWREAQIKEALAKLPLPEGKKPTKKLRKDQDKAKAAYPDDLLDCLQKDTTWVRSHGWNRPPGSRRVFYWRPSNAISVGAPKARTAARRQPRVEAMLLSLTNTSRNDHALPPVTRTLPQAELLHRNLVGIAAKMLKAQQQEKHEELLSPELTGRDDNRRPLRGPHEHAHINPLDLDGDGHLDHILVWAPGGLGAEAQAAIRAARTTYTKGSGEPLRLAPAVTGDLQNLARLPLEYGQRVIRLVSRSVSSDGATVWESLTPFVPPRYLKLRGKNTLEGQIHAELQSRGYPEPASVHPFAPMFRNQNDAVSAGSAAGERSKTTWSRFRHFKIMRQRGPTPPVVCWFGIRLEFDRPVRGPIALGYASHFGLGLFTAVDP